MWKLLPPCYTLVVVLQRAFFLQFAANVVVFICGAFISSIWFVPSWQSWILISGRVCKFCSCHCLLTRLVYSEQVFNAHFDDF
jgi:hypothetical protein